MEQMKRRDAEVAERGAEIGKHNVFLRGSLRDLRDSAVRFGKNFWHTGQALRSSGQDDAEVEEGYGQVVHATVA